VPNKIFHPLWRKAGRENRKRLTSVKRINIATNPTEKSKKNENKPLEKRFLFSRDERS
jgi:hypothetical protein